MKSLKPKILISMKRFFYSLILVTDIRPTIGERSSYVFNLLLAFGPIAYFLDGINFWFKTNQQFSSFVLICLLANMFVGAIFHHKVGTFDWVEMFKKNAIMWGILIIVYAMLEMLRITAGQNFVGEGFKIVIQITTLLYPISKVLKNAYVLSNRQFPPAFIMDKIYNFEKNGNMNELFNDKKE